MPFLSPVEAPACFTAAANPPLQQDDIQTGLLEGSLDLGLVNLLEGDDGRSELATTDLLHGRPVVVLPAGHPLAARESISTDDLRAERIVLMRAGYLMHRFAHRLFGGDLPAHVHSTDGAELGKMMVAEGLGLTLLPDYSVDGDPLHRAGLIVTRPVSDDTTRVTLVLEHRHGPATPQVRSLVQHLVAAASERTSQGSGPLGLDPYDVRNSNASDVIRIQWQDTRSL